MMEEGGIATIVIASGVFRNRLAAMQLPRAMLTRHPMGRPLGMPGDHQEQRRIILEALNLLEYANKGGIIVDLPDIFVQN
jgi:hypothetical protein